jgi:hypothetical protein
MQPTRQLLIALVCVAAGFSPELRAADLSSLPTDSATTTAAPAQPSRRAPGSSSSLPKGFLSANIGGNLSTRDFTNQFTFDLYREQAHVDTQYGVPASLAVDVGGGFRFWGHLAAAIAVTNSQSKEDASISAQIPHPFLLNKPRSITGTASGLSRKETAVHLDAAYLAPLSRRLLLIAFGGASIFSVNQDIVTGVRVGEVYPYDEASFTSATTTRASDSPVGFNVGADLTYQVWPNFGFGGTVRFAHATAKFSESGVSTGSVDVGGAIVSGGVRWLF